MMKRIREMKDQDGFTLIELMVVVLIIAILIAIAIPTFLGLRERAQDKAAQSDLRNGLTAAKGFYSDDDTYTGFTAAIAEGIEPSLTWDVIANAAVGTVGIAVVATDHVRLMTESSSGTFFCLQDNAGATGYGDGTAVTAVTDCGSAEW